MPAFKRAIWSFYTSLEAEWSRGAGFQAGYARFHAGILVAQAFLPVFVAQADSLRNPRFQAGIE